MIGDKEFLCDDFCPSIQAGEIDANLRSASQLAELFKVLGDETRVRLIYLLGRRETCVCDLASVLGLSPPAISHHLRLLRNTKLVTTRREGKMVYYKLHDDHMLNIVNQALAFLE